MAEKKKKGENPIVKGRDKRVTQTGKGQKAGGERRSWHGEGSQDLRREMKIFIFALDRTKEITIHTREKGTLGAKSPKKAKESKKERDKKKGKKMFMAQQQLGRTRI